MERYFPQILCYKICLSLLILYSPLVLLSPRWWTHSYDLVISEFCACQMQSSRYWIVLVSCLPLNCRFHSYVSRWKHLQAGGLCRILMRVLWGFSLMEGKGKAGLDKRRSHSMIQAHQLWPTLNWVPCRVLALHLYPCSSYSVIGLIIAASREAYTQQLGNRSSLEEGLRALCLLINNVRPWQVRMGIWWSAKVLLFGKQLLGI